MLIRQIALVSEVSAISASELSTVSAAVQKQVTRDFGPIWEVRATVDSFHKLEDVPLGYWPVLVQDDIHQSGALGIHLDRNNQPFALVTHDENWALTTSHEVLEMLADPFGNRIIAGDSPKSDQGRVEFLVEVCDPSEAEAFGYTVNGITLSDFYTPSYFDPVVGDGVRYSFTGALTEPRQVLSGGYLSWREPITDHWWQEVFFDAQAEFRDLGSATALKRVGESLRSMIDRETSQGRHSMAAGPASLLAARSTKNRAMLSSRARADSLRDEIEKLKGKPDGGDEGEPSEPGPKPERRRPRPSWAAGLQRRRLTIPNHAKPPVEARALPPLAGGLGDSAGVPGPGTGFAALTRATPSRHDPGRAAPGAPIMTVNDQEARKARAQQLRRAIQDIQTPCDPPEGPTVEPTVEPTPAAPESPRDYVHRKMNEIDRKAHP